MYSKKILYYVSIVFLMIAILSAFSGFGPIAIIFPWLLVPLVLFFALYMNPLSELKLSLEEIKRDKCLHNKEIRDIVNELDRQVGFMISISTKIQDMQDRKNFDYAACNDVYEKSISTFVKHSNNVINVIQSGMKWGYSEKDIASCRKHIEFNEMLINDVIENMNELGSIDLEKDYTPSSHTKAIRTVKTLIK